MSIFLITVRTKEGDDNVRILRAALKVLWRRFGLKSIRVEEEKLVDPDRKARNSSPNGTDLEQLRDCGVERVSP